MARKRLVLAGIVGRYPVGGVTWCALQYIAGFQRLGYDVFYVEDTGECNFDPVQNAIATDPAYALDYIRRQLELVGLEDSWAYVDYQGGYHGKTRAQVAEACAGADLMVNLSGGCWNMRPEYERLPKVFIDTDPGFTQEAIAEAGEGWYRDFFASHDALFTFALRVDDPSCTLAETPFRWHPTIQPVELDMWPVSSRTSGRAFHDDPELDDRKLPRNRKGQGRRDSSPDRGARADERAHPARGRRKASDRIARRARLGADRCSTGDDRRRGLPALHPVLQGGARLREGDVRRDA